jgi:hypothetical protein
MIGTVRARPNHYETLGLKPTASDDEIAQAFAREIRAPRPSAFGGLVEVSVAYETLRDPARRRAHDAALGLKREPPPQQYVMATARWAGTQFIGAAPARPSHDKLPPAPAPAAAPAAAKPEPPAEPTPASFVAAREREPDSPRPQPPRAPAPEAKAKLEPQTGRDRPLRQVEQLRLAETEHHPLEWRRPAILVGAPIAAVVLIGALAGWQAGKGEAQPQSVTAALPPPKPHRVTGAPAPERSVAEAHILGLPRAGFAPVRTKRAPAAPTPGASEDPLAARPEPSQVAETAADAPIDSGAEPAAVATEAPAVETAAAMPLSKAVIARTIHRIGYACGQVASTSAVEGARGVYNVTCTSGASYQAKPVRGRYHFRRTGSR